LWQARGHPWRPRNHHRSTTDPALTRLVLPGIFDGTHQFALDNLGGHTRLTQSETFPGALVPLAGKTITQTEAGFQALNQALKQRVEHAARRPAAGRAYPVAVSGGHSVPAIS
jgi:hypothetical protein